MLLSAGCSVSPMVGGGEHDAQGLVTWTQPHSFLNIRSGWCIGGVETVAVTLFHPSPPSHPSESADQSRTVRAGLESVYIRR